MINPIIAIKDNFFEDGHLVAESLGYSQFGDYKLGVDGVTYPFIATHIPLWVKYEFLYKLENTIGARVAVNYLFVRAMPQGITAPAKIHSDRDMGAFTAHVYLSRRSEASTAFYRHETEGFVATPAHTGEEWNPDTKDPKWSKYLSVHGELNRLLVHKAEYFHCAEPEDGFGIIGKDARLVLTCFFDVF